MRQPTNKKREQNGHGQTHGHLGHNGVYKTFDLQRRSDNHRGRVPNGDSPGSHNDRSLLKTSKIDKRTDFSLPDELRRPNGDPRGIQISRPDVWETKFRVGVVATLSMDKTRPVPRCGQECTVTDAKVTIISGGCAALQGSFDGASLPSLLVDIFMHIKHQFPAD